MRGLRKPSVEGGGSPTEDPEIHSDSDFRDSELKNDFKQFHGNRIGWLNTYIPRVEWKDIWSSQKAYQSYLWEKNIDTLYLI